jgi:hypothetical protein
MALSLFSVTGSDAVEVTQNSSGASETVPPPISISCFIRETCLQPHHKIWILAPSI